MSSRHLVSLLLTSALALGGCAKKDSPADQPARSAAPARDGFLKVGESAPDFEAVAHDGQTVKLSALRGKVIVLYFYPKDGTSGCTTEAQGFRDEKQSLDAAGAVVLGVSADDNESHRGFASEQGLPFLLLPDTEHAIAEAYGVGSFLGMPSRVTYLIDRQGKIVKVYPSVEPQAHAKEIVRDLEALQ